MKSVLILILILFSQLNAQNNFITGRVIDSKTKEPLSSANVLLFKLPDSSMTGTATGRNGRFRIENVKPGMYALSVKYLGYKTHTTKFELTNKSIDVETISLERDSVEIDQVIVTEKLPVMVQSGDTTVFNAEAFKVNKDAVAEDLLTKVPGIQVEDGKVKAQGEEVKKVYVDGKTFFGDDPNAALKNIPADIIEKIQMFDQQSEQSQFTGLDDGNTSKAINIVTRINIQNGTFGKLTAGAGTDERYNLGGNVNFFDQDQRISLVGQINNTNEQNFSAMDLLGAMGGGSRRSGGRSGGSFMGAPGGMGMPMGGGFESLFAIPNGDTKTYAFGVNYNDKWFEDLEFGTSYFFNNTNSDLNSLLNREYFVSTFDGQTYTENTFSESRNTNHRINLRMDYQIDSLNSIRFIPSFSLQKNKSESHLTAFTNTAESRLNYSDNLTSSDMNGLNASSLLMYRHRFNSAGRSVSLSLNTSYKKNDGTQNTYSESIYYNSLFDSDTLNQLTDILNDGLTLSTELVYTEPVDQNNFFTINASHSFSTEKSDRKAFNFSDITNSYSLFDDSLSNIYKRDYTANALGIGYRYRKDKLSIHANINYNIAKLENEQEYPFNASLERKFYSFLPSLMVRYNISRDQNLNIFYRSFNNAPSATQLQNVLDNSNPLQLSIGNPNLSQETNHNLGVRFSTLNFSNMHSLFIMLSGSYRQNYIGNRTIIAGNDTTTSAGILLLPGTQLRIPENVTGYISLQSFLTYGMPFSFISSNFNTNFSVNYTRTPGIINDITNYSNSMRYGLGISISSNISTEVDFLISSTSYFNQVRNSSAERNNEDYFSQTTRLKFYWMLFSSFVFQSELNHNYDGGLSDQYDPNTFILNLYIGRKFFADNSGELRFSVADVLNQNNNISRRSTDYYTQEYSTNVVGRYFLLSFIYNIRAFN